MRAKTEASRTLAFPLQYVCIYQLVDVDTGGGGSSSVRGIPEEDHFGLVHSDTFSKKPAFEELAMQLALF